MHEPTSRIVYVDPRAAADLPASFAEGASLGFNHVLLPPPWQPSPRGDRFAPAALDILDPALGVQTLPALALHARSAGLGLLLDLQVNRLAAGTGETLGEGLFHGADPLRVLDPRGHVNLGADTALPQDTARAGALGEFWGRHAAGWARDGVAGLRILGLDGIPAPILPAFLAALSRGAAGLALYAWTPGLNREQRQALRGADLAGVFSSYPWWDGHAAWFWEEIAELAEIAPVLHAPEAPFGERLAARVQDPAEAPSLYKRAAALAATMGQGWLALHGAEHEAGADIGAFIRGLNALLDGNAALRGPGTPMVPTGSGGQVAAILRTDTPDRRHAGCATVTVVNRDAAHARTLESGLLIGALGGRFPELRQRLPEGPDLAPGPLSLGPGEVRIYTAAQARRAAPVTRTDEASAREGAAAPRLAIESIRPAVDDGAFPVKRTVGDSVEVTADLLFDGHEKIAGALRWRAPGAEDWSEARLRPLGNDSWTGEFPLTMLGRYEFAVQTWRDAFETFRDEIAKKHAAGVAITMELNEGIAHVKRFAKSASGDIAAALKGLRDKLEKAGDEERRTVLLSEPVARLMAAADPRPFAVTSAAMQVDSERLEARYASWYEVFPRSMSDDPNRHGTFDDVIGHLPRVRAMGFDVLYFPPIHPIGRKNRKGRNNTLTPAPEDPGSPYAIGSDAGGHDAIHPELGDFAAFQRLRDAAAEHGLELAIDFAIQCAPDHPWLREHPGWFDWRPDGTIKYAENPPKKYEDIVNVDFYAEDSIPGLWMELCRVVLFWASQGVRLFRVDNPHTKPFPFWEWMIREVRQRYPDAAFLAEAFTRPKIMYRLAKIGFSQSYTYFTWRNEKAELTAYLTELADEAPRDFFRPHFFVNTPDINPVFLQTSGRPGFLIRAALAATLSGLWGVYNGFELCEGTPVPGKEEYLDSEKYQIRAWDWNRPGNIVAEIAQLNQIRRDNPALQTHLGVRFHNAYNDAILYYGKSTPDHGNVVLVAVSLDPTQAQEADFEVPLWEWGLPDTGAVEVTDLIDGHRFTWHGKIQHVRLTQDRPYAFWRVAADSVTV